MFAFDKDKINNYAKAYGVKIEYNWNKDIDGYEFQLEKGMWKEMFIISRLDLDRSNVPESYFYEHVFMHIRDISKAGYTLEGLL